MRRLGDSSCARYDSRHELRQLLNTALEYELMKVIPSHPKHRIIAWSTFPLCPYRPDCWDPFREIISEANPVATKLLIRCLRIKLDDGYILQRPSKVLPKKTATSAICSLQGAQLRRHPMAVCLVILAARCSNESAPTRPAPHQFCHRRSTLYQSTLHHCQRHFILQRCVTDRLSRRSQST